MNKRELARSFYIDVLIKERERTGYCTPGKRWFDGEPRFDVHLIKRVIEICDELADMFIEVEELNLNQANIGR